MRLASKVLGRKSPLTRPTGEPETEAPTQQASTIQKQSRKPKPPKPTKTQTQPSQQPPQPEKIKLGREEIKDPKLIQQLMKKATP